MLLSYLLGLEEGKASERKRLESEAQKLNEEKVIALKEQYILGLLMPVRGQKSFKVVVREPNLFDFSMVRELLKRIESPVKYFKYYKVGDTKVLEGYSTGGEEYVSFKKTELTQNAVILVSAIIIFTLAFIFNEQVLHLEEKNIFLFILYQLFSLSFSITLGGLGSFLVFHQEDESILEYGRL